MYIEKEKEKYAREQSEHFFTETKREWDDVRELLQDTTRKLAMAQKSDARNGLSQVPFTSAKYNPFRRMNKHRLTGK